MEASDKVKFRTGFTGRKRAIGKRGIPGGLVRVLVCCQFQGRGDLCHPFSCIQNRRETLHPSAGLAAIGLLTDSKLLDRVFGATNGRNLHKNFPNWYEKRSNYSSWSFHKREIQPKGKIYQGRLQLKRLNFDRTTSQLIISCYNKDMNLSCENCYLQLCNKNNFWLMYQCNTSQTKHSTAFLFHASEVLNE